MSKSDNKVEWNDYENETLIHNHKMSKIYKKRYQRASDFHNSLYRLFGLITVVTSSVASTLSWGKNETDGSGEILDDKFLISTIMTISAISAAIQNFYNFQENSNNYITTAKSYAKLQNKIESVGNIHPEYRIYKPHSFNKKIQDKFDQISDSRLEVTNFMTNCCYSKQGDDISYLEEKHNKYKDLKDEEKLNYTKNDKDIISIAIESDDSENES
tara:strand:- start:133 stop:777 length:645 start_codon:yes stop_codon:yes gene_type:complete